MIKVIVNGASGKMGVSTVAAVERDPALQLVAACGKDDNLVDAIKKFAADVVIDFTSADVAFENANKIIDAGVHPVIGTTGFLPAQVEQLVAKCKAKQLGGVLAPNFSIGAVLMMKYAQDCARYLPHVEIIEMHHDGKQDSPSGTALRTADLIARARAKGDYLKPSKEIVSGARGATVQGVAVHAVRLPGLVAHQMVMFGGLGESFTLRHDALSRECFMPGVILATKKVMELNEMVVGLEHIL